MTREHGGDKSKLHRPADYSASEENTETMEDFEISTETPAGAEEAKIEAVDEAEILEAMKLAEEAGVESDQAVAASDFVGKGRVGGRHPAAEETYDLNLDEWDISEMPEPSR